MSMVRRILARGKLRQARRELARNPSPMNYASLANQYAWGGGLREALRVAEEGLRLFKGNPELVRLSTRLRRIQQEDLLAELREELKEAPRPAVWNEICEILMDSGQYRRAEETARDWQLKAKDPEAALAIARACVMAYLTDLDRNSGRRAFEAVEHAQHALARDPRPFRLRLKLASDIGAWDDAREAAKRVLELDPGDPALEARYRSLCSMPTQSPDVERALINVQSTGRLVGGDMSRSQRNGPVGEVRPLLQDLYKRDGVAAAVYVRSSTALVQGMKGATAERGARSVRSMVLSGRSAARRLGLGQITEMELDGDFGSMLLVAGEMDAGALWCDKGRPAPGDRQALMNLVGAFTAPSQNAGGNAA